MDKIVVEHLFLNYSDGAESLKDISMRIPANTITVLFGPSGGGKSTLMRVFNRLNDLADVVMVSGKVLITGNDGTTIDVLDEKTDVVTLRRMVGMVFARPIVLPMTIRQNLTYGLELAGFRDHMHLEQAVERSLKQAALWDEVKDRLNDASNSTLGRSAATPVPGTLPGARTGDCPAG